jgi:hypothetical protein
MIDPMISPRTRSHPRSHRLKPVAVSIERREVDDCSVGAAARAAIAAIAAAM